MFHSLIVIWFLLVPMNAWSLLVGSDLDVSLESFVTFPEIITLEENEVATFAYMKNGFELENSDTELLFRSVYPVAGTVNFNGGTVTLGNDFIFQNVTTLNGLGVVIGAGHIFHISSSVTKMPANTDIFENTHLSFEENISLNTNVLFRGDCILSGANNNLLTLQDNGQLIIDSSSQLHIKDINIMGLSGEKIRCLDNSSTITLQNSTLFLDQNYGFTTGNLEILETSIIEGADFSFTYSSSQPLKIKSKSTLKLNRDVIFTYAPTSFASNGIVFSDSTSQLILDGCIIRTISDLALIKGLIKVTQTSTLEDNSLNGITIGDGTAANDCVVSILSGPRLQLSKGILNYNNFKTSSWQMAGSNSILTIQKGARLNLLQNLNLTLGIALFEDNTVLGRAAGKTIIGSNHIQGSVTIKPI